MGIRIAHQPVVAPLVAAYATGVGQAQQRVAARQGEILQQRELIGARNKMQQEGQRFEAEQREQDRVAMAQRDFNRQFIFDGQQWVDRDVWGQGQQAARDEATNQRFRDKDESDALYKQIAEAEQWMMNTPMTPAGEAKKAYAAESLRRVREQQQISTPNVHRQWMAQWLQAFSNDNPQSWAAPPPDALGEMNKNDILLDPAGTVLESGTVKPGMKLGGFISSDRNGARRYQQVGGQKAATATGFPATSQEFFTDPVNRKDTRARAIQELRGERDAESDVNKAAAPITAEEIRDKMLELYEFDKGMVTPPAQEGGAPMAAPAQQGAAGQWGGVPMQLPPETGAAPAQPPPVVGAAPAPAAPQEWTPTTPEAQALRAQAGQQPAAPPVAAPVPEQKGFTPQAAVPVPEDKRGPSQGPALKITPELVGQWVARAPLLKESGMDKVLLKIAAKAPGDLTETDINTLWNAYYRAQMAGAPQ